jgi:CRISPR-associated protein Csx17
MLPVVDLPGLRPDSLGNYMAALGLLRVASRRWPLARGAWREGRFVLVGGPLNLNDLSDHLQAIARSKSWSPYDRFWKDAQSDPSVLAVLAGTVSESEAHLLAAHVVPGGGRCWFNPLLGSGGNAGRRDFSRGWRTARDELADGLVTVEPAAKGKRKKSAPIHAVSDLRAFLEGGDCSLQKDWGAGSWFSQAVETANSGQSPTSRGQVTPWAMLLACEALPLFAGSPSRRLGGRARTVAAFPFASEPAAPRTSGEAGKAKGELWLPLWERPMTVPEVRWLFWRARAEVGDRGATTPAAFGAAVLRRGVDAALTGFARFTLAATTGQTFEPRMEGLVVMRGQAAGAPGSAVSRAEGLVAERVLALFDQLPRDEKAGNSWRVRGFRAPLEAALVARAAEPTSVGTARALADALVQVLDRVDRNQAARKRNLRWQFLPREWLLALFGDGEPSLEARLAMSVASLLSNGAVPSFAAYRFGAELGGDWARHPPQPPSRWIWRTRDTEQCLIALVRRRLVDAEEGPALGAEATGLPFRASVSVSLADVHAWLRRDVDDDVLGRWIGRIALFDWRRLRQAAYTNPRLRDVVRPRGAAIAADADLAAYGLLRPLLDSRTVPGPDGEPVFAEPAVRTVASARRLVALLSAGAGAAALDHARSRYAMGLNPLAEFRVGLDVSGPRRVLASLAFAAPTGELGRLVERFLRPERAAVTRRTS